MEEYKVFIPSAGIGSRVAGLNSNFNKAMLEVNNKPVISHIIEKFDKDVPIVIAIGYQGDLLRQFLVLAYPDRNITFVEVENFEGPESGLGVTINAAKEYLQCPFIFISNDTLILDEIPSPDKWNENWIGYANYTGGTEYRTVRVDEPQITWLYEKGKSPWSPAYIGVAGIKDYSIFWSWMEDYESKTEGESYALKRMIEEEYFAGVKFNWIDTGSVDGYNDAKKNINEDRFSILEKPDEAIWFVEDKVIKYSSSKSFITNRAFRAITLEPFVPEILGATENMYSYEFIHGRTFSHVNSVGQFRYLLEFLGNFWGARGDSNVECKEFYLHKTIQRVSKYFQTFNNFDSRNEIINGKKYSSVSDSFLKIPEKIYYPTIPARFHGDLHFENIIINESQDGHPFTLIDWRQDFNGNLINGDIYYDLGKLLHGLMISHELVLNNFFSVDRNGNEINFSYYRKSSYIEYEKIFFDWAEAQEFDIEKIKIITALIFLNIAGLHHYPYSHLLFYLGKTMLGDTLDNLWHPMQVGKQQFS